MAKKAKAQKAKPRKKSPEKNGFWRHPSFKLSVGLILIFASLFLIGAFISYYSSGKADQDWLEFRAEGGNRPELIAQNLFGRVGARVAHQFIFYWFGVGAFLIPWFILLFGLRLSFKVALKRLVPRLTGLVFLLLWIPAAADWLLPSEPFLSGLAGYHYERWLRALVGPWGEGVILLASFIVFLILRFRITNEQLTRLWKRLGTRKKDAQATDHLDPVEEIRAQSFAEDEPKDQQSEENSDANTALDLEVETQDNSTETTLENRSDEPGQAEHQSEVEEENFQIEKTTDEEELSEKELNRKLKEFGEYDPKLDLSKFKLPTLDLLRDYGSANIKINQQELEENKNKIVETLNNYNIDISKIKATIGPTVTLYEIIPAAGVRISKIKNLEDDIALSLSALGIRIIAPIPGKGTIGIEVPSTNPQMVPMRNLIAGEKFQKSEMELPVAMGKTISNETFIADLARMPHLLMAGATGQGKSVGLNVILASLLYKKHPSQVKFVLVDPKKVELTLFNKIERHYLAKLPDSEEAIITDTNKVINTLNSLCLEMDARYELLKNAMVRNIKEYNAKFIKRKLNPEEGHRYLPYIVLVIDEFADLIMTAGKEVETPIARLAQLARAIGIHLIVATQRPSVNVITGIIKANFPARAAFRVTSKVDSRTILDAGGAEQLIGKGDMLLSQGQDLIRLQCAFVDTPEIEEITDYIGAQQAYPEAYQLPEYKGDDDEGGSVDILDPSERDGLFEDAARLLVIHQQGSASLLQRKLKLGYNRAGRIIDQLEAAGIIGPFEGSKARQVLIPDEMALEQLLENEKNQNG